MQFENLSFIGPGSVAAGRVAAAASQQNRLWNFVDLMYLNQGEENTGYVTPTHLQRLLEAVPALNVRQALESSRSPAAIAALSSADQVASRYGIAATPSFLIGTSGRSTASVPALIVGPGAVPGRDRPCAGTGEMNDALLRRATAALGSAGVGVAGYLTYVHYAGLPRSAEFRTAVKRFRLRRTPACLGSRSRCWASSPTC
jgi:hypothetical protein